MYILSTHNSFWKRNNAWLVAIIKAWNEYILCKVGIYIFEGSKEWHLAGFVYNIQTIIFDSVEKKFIFSVEISQPQTGLNWFSILSL